CTSAWANSSILRSKSWTVRASDRARLRPIGTRNAAHMMQRSVSSNHCTTQPPACRSPVPTQHLGWDGTVAPHLVPMKHIDVIFPQAVEVVWKGVVPGSAGAILAAAPAGFRQEPDPLDPR